MKTILNFKTPLMTSVKVLAVFICLCFSVASYATVVTYPQVPGVQACQFSYTLKARDHGTTTWNTVYLYNTPVTNATGGETNTTCGYLSCSGSQIIKLSFPLRLPVRRFTLHHLISPRPLPVIPLCSLLRGLKNSMLI
jgi:hypothetical protein